MAHVTEFEIEGLAGRKDVYAKKLNLDVNIFWSQRQRKDIAFKNSAFRYGRECADVEVSAVHRGRSENIQQKV